MYFFIVGMTFYSLSHSTNESPKLHEKKVTSPQKMIGQMFDEKIWSKQLGIGDENSKQKIKKSRVRVFKHN